MAKWMASMSLATWLLFALAVIVCRDHTFISAGPIEKVKKIFGCCAENWTDEDWRRHGKAVLAEKKKRGFWWYLPSDAKHWLEKKIGVPRKTDCTEKMTNDLIVWRSGANKSGKFYAILNNYLRVYLHECGLEKGFKRAWDELKQGSPEHWISDKYKTLHRYLKTGDWSADAAMQFLSIVKDISELDGITKEIDCTDEHMTTVVMKRIFDWQGSFKNLLNVYGRLYLRECGFEERFKKAIENVEQVSGKQWNSVYYPTLFDYSRKKIWNQSDALQLLSAIREISEPGSITGEIDCTEKHVAHVVELFVTSHNYADLHQFLGGYYAFYLNKCGFEDHFQRALEISKKFTPKRWDLSKHSTLSSYLLDEFFLPNAIISLLSVIKEISDQGDSSLEIDCTDEQRAKLLELHNKTRIFLDLRNFLGGYLAFYSKECDTRSV